MHIPEKQKQNFRTHTFAYVLLGDRYGELRCAGGNGADLQNRHCVLAVSLLMSRKTRNWTLVSKSIPVWWKHVWS